MIRDLSVHTVVCDAGCSPTYASPSRRQQQEEAASHNYTDLSHYEPVGAASPPRQQGTSHTQCVTASSVRYVSQTLGHRLVSKVRHSRRHWAIAESARYFTHTLHHHRVSKVRHTYTASPPSQQRYVTHSLTCSTRNLLGRYHRLVGKLRHSFTHCVTILQQGTSLTYCVTISTARCVTHILGHHLVSKVHHSSTHQVTTSSIG